MAMNLPCFHTIRQLVTLKTAMHVCRSVQRRKIEVLPLAHTPSTPSLLDYGRSSPLERFETTLTHSAWTAPLSWRSRIPEQAT